MNQSVGKASVFLLQAMLFGGTGAPCASAYLMSIGKLGVEENKKGGVPSMFVTRDPTNYYP
jgi:hypothetical protein